jgi:hypothetical protein
MRQLGEGWLLAYREYTKQSESPEPFHLWVGMSAISAALRRHVWIKQGHYTIYPNIYVVLVAPSGQCKKSTALNIGLRLIRQVPGVVIESNKLTPQSLIHTLSGGMISVTQNQGPAGPQTPEELKEAVRQHAASISTKNGSIILTTECTAVIASTELSVTIGKDAEQNGLLGLLTDLYDCHDHWSYNTRGRGREELENVYLTILAATTPNWLGNSIPIDAIGDGFTSRILFVSQLKRRHDNPRPTLSPEEVLLGKILIEDLKHIAGLRGEMNLTPEADKYYDSWYRNRPKSDLDERFNGYLERKPDHLLKIAGLVSISASDRLIIEKKHIDMSLELLAMLETNMPNAFRGQGQHSKDIDRILQLLEASTNFAMSFPELCQKSYRYQSVQELQASLDMMRSAGMVTDRVQGSNRTITLLPGFAAKTI